MKARDIFRIGIFIVVFFLLNQLFSSIFLVSSRSNFNYFVSTRNFEMVRDQASLVFLGDSHPQKSVMAAKIPNAYNFSSSAESYVLTYYKVRHYLEGGDFHPQVAVVEIDPHCFSSHLIEKMKNQDPVFWGQFVNYYEYGRTSNSLPEFIPIGIQSSSSLIGGADVVSMNLWPQTNPDSLDLHAGYLATYKDFSEQSIDRIRNEADFTAQRHFYGYTYLDPILVKYFARLLDLLEEYDIKVILVWYPVSKQYYNRSASYVPIESHLETIQSFVSDRPIDLILDYHELFFENPEYFSDPDHLNIHGAEIFTRLLIEDLTEAGVLPVTSVEN